MPDVVTVVSAVTVLTVVTVPEAIVVGITADGPCGRISLIVTLAVRKSYTAAMPTVHVVVEAGAVLPLTMRICKKRSASSSGRLTTREARIVVGNVAALATNWSNNAAYPLDTCAMPMCPGEAVVLIVAVVSPELYPLRWVSKFMAVAVAPE